MHRSIGVHAAVLILAGAVIVACGGSSSSSSSATSPGGSPAPPPAPVAPGSGIGPSDESYCAADRQREARCGGNPSAYDQHRCLEGSCTLRATHGVQVADAIKNCLLQRPCGAHSHDPCNSMVLGAHAQTPAAQQANARCEPFARRCGGQIAAGYGKTVPCAYVALLGPELFAALNPCFDLACGLGQQCTAGAITRALVACDLPETR